MKNLGIEVTGNSCKLYGAGADGDYVVTMCKELFSANVLLACCFSCYDGSTHFNRGIFLRYGSWIMG